MGSRRLKGRLATFGRGGRYTLLNGWQLTCKRMKILYILITYSVKHLVPWSRCSYGWKLAFDKAYETSGWFAPSHAIPSNNASAYNTKKEHSHLFKQSSCNHIPNKEVPNSFENNQLRFEPRDAPTPYWPERLLNKLLFSSHKCIVWWEQESEPLHIGRICKVLR